MVPRAVRGSTARPKKMQLPCWWHAVPRPSESTARTEHNLPAGRSAGQTPAASNPDSNCSGQAQSRHLRESTAPRRSPTRLRTCRLRRRPAKLNCQEQISPFPHKTSSRPHAAPPHDLEFARQLHSLPRSAAEAPRSAGEFLAHPACEFFQDEAPNPTISRPPLAGHEHRFQPPAGRPESAPNAQRVRSLRARPGSNHPPPCTAEPNHRRAQGAPLQATS